MNNISFNVINEQHSSITTEQLNIFFDKINDEFTKNKTLMTNYDILNEIISTLNLANKRQLCTESYLNHRIFTILRDCLIHLLSEKTDLDLIVQISVLFKVVTYHCIMMNRIEFQNNSLFEPLFNAIGKCLIQHDQIKIELTELDRIPILIRCVNEEKFDLLKIRQIALSFYDKAFSIIKNDENFLNYLKILLNSSERTIQQVIERFIWRFESPIKPLSNDNDLNYDTMLSYSHSDKQLCHQLYEQLTNDGYRVWLDRDQMHGSTMIAMANAIERSEFVLICTYKQSANCQVEANYAFERRCQLIPLVMKPNYRPDGWLGIIVSGKMRVDFPKLQFQSACSTLKHEIEQKRKNKKMIIHINEQVSVQDAPIIDLPHCIDSWSEEHVSSFLHINNLNELLSVFADFDGQLLYEAYSMCQASREKMFELLKIETASSNTFEQLKLGTYLRFLKELKKYI